MYIRIWWCLFCICQTKLKQTGAAEKGPRFISIHAYITCRDICVRNPRTPIGPPYHVYFETRGASEGGTPHKGICLYP